MLQDPRHTLRVVNDKMAAHDLHMAGHGLHNNLFLNLETKSILFDDHRIIYHRIITEMLRNFFF